MESSDLQTNPLAFLSQLYSKEIEENEKHTELWTQYKKKHESAIEALKTLVSELTVNCMVPIGKKALMKGKLKHTNEVLACIGDGYFVSYSSQQAIELCNRRIKRSEEFLQKLEKERNLFEARQNMPLDIGAFGFGDSKDVTELWDDKKIENWRVEHRKKEKEYRQKLIETKNLNIEKTNENLEEDLFKRLDELEIEEELADELNRLEEQQLNSAVTRNDKSSLDDECESQGECEDEDECTDEYESTDDEDEDEDEQENEDEDEDQGNECKTNQEKKCEEKIISEEKSGSLEEQSSEKVTKGAQNFINNKDKFYIKDNKINGKFEVSIVNEDIIKDMSNKSSLHLKQKKEIGVKSNTANNIDACKSDSNHIKLKSSGKRVSFANPQSSDVRSFSNFDNTAQCSSKLENATENCVNNDSSDDIIKIEFTHSKTQFHEEDVKDDINSPSDIYKIFSYKPKSILKSSTSPIYVHKSISVIDESLQEEEEEEDEEQEAAENDAIKKSTYNTVIHDIQERKVDSTVTQSSETSDKKRPISRFKLERANKKKT